MKTRAVFFTDIKKLEIRELDLPDPDPNQVQVKSIINGICMFEVWKYISWGLCLYQSMERISDFMHGIMIRELSILAFGTTKVRRY